VIVAGGGNLVLIGCYHELPLRFVTRHAGHVAGEDHLFRHFHPSERVEPNHDVAQGIAQSAEAQAQAAILAGERSA